MQQRWAAAGVCVCLVGFGCAADPVDDGAGGASGKASSNAGTGGSTPAASGGSPAPVVDAVVPALGGPVTPGDPGSADVMLEVRTDQPLHGISELIYGTNGAPDSMRTRQTVMRSGGNRMTAYNWETNASNAGSDYQFQNDNYLSSSTEPAKPILDMVKQAQGQGAAAIVTVPLVDYVSGDTKGGGDVRNSGSDYLMTRFKQSKEEKGMPFADKPDTSDGFVYQDEFVNYLKTKVPQGSRVMFSMDNEPDLWSSTHAEVHPKAVTYAELWDRNQRYAGAVKRVWPEAEVLGFVSYGWNGYVTLQNAPDAMGRNFIDWYLDQAKAGESSAGKRLIDYLDLHWYPEAQGGGTRIIEKNNNADVVAAREQAPRSLWDKTYNEKSWIHDNVSGPIYLVPRLQAKIDQHYPGTKLAFTEWNYGGGNHISGTIACADVLGVFGREGVALATYWPLGDAESFAYAAFRAYRNYDGAGGTFGNVSVSATTSDVDNVTVYASLRDTTPDQVTLVVINKATADKTVGLKLAHPSMFSKLSSYRVSGTSAELMKQADQASVATNAWKLTLPAQSVTVLVPVK